MIPPCYILQPITSKYPWFDDSDPANKDRRQADRAGWENDSRQLSDVLRQCARAALDENILPEKDVMQFFKSGKIRFRIDLPRQYFFASVKILFYSSIYDK